MSKRKLTSDEYELLTYKLEVIERRLDNLEKKGDGNINMELMQLVMSMLRQQAVGIPQSQQQHPQAVVPTPIGPPQTPDPICVPMPSQSSILDGFSMNRRRAMGV